MRKIGVYNMPLLDDEQYFDEHPDGLLHAEANSSNDVRVSELADERNGLTLRGAGPGLGFSRDGTLLLTSGPSGAIRLWGVPATVPAAD